MFERPHHQVIATLLGHLDGDLLHEHRCFFGGGTAMALKYGEYRESVDVDFLVADPDRYRSLRNLVSGSSGLSALTRGAPLPLARDVRIDQYGIRTAALVSGLEIKFEIVREARIPLDAARDRLCGVPVLRPVDMAASKLLANSDRGMDDGTFNRDIIDLAMMAPARAVLSDAVEKASSAYGPCIVTDAAKAIGRLRDREGWLERCMQAMAMAQPKAAVWQKIRSLQRKLGGAVADG